MRPYSPLLHSFISWFPVHEHKVICFKSSLAMGAGVVKYINNKWPKKKKKSRRGKLRKGNYFTATFCCSQKSAEVRKLILFHRLEDCQCADINTSVKSLHCFGLHTELANVSWTCLRCLINTYSKKLKTELQQECLYMERHKKCPVYSLDLITANNLWI